MTADLLASVADLFARVEPRRHATAVVTGLQTQLETKNCWSLAQNAGHDDPWRLQHFFNDAKWDEDALRERGAAAAWEQHLAHRPERVLVFDETGDLKKGEHTLGVQRQYTGTAGRIENAQVTVYAAWATGTERVLVDYEVYLPKSWTDDPERLDRAGVPAGLPFRTKIEQASAILARRIAAGQVPTALAGDAVYGRSGPLRAQAEAAGIAYVLEVGKDKQVSVHAEVEAERVDALAESIPTRNWSNRSAGAGSKGQRVYAWGYLALDSTGADGERGLLVRWNRRTNEYAYYLTYQPVEAVNLGRLIRIAGLRWPVETCFQDAKGHFGLDEHQMRTWTSVRRWITLCLLAAAAIAIAHHLARSQGSRLSLTGLARLHGQIIRPAHPDDHRYYWSEWICDHNETARRSHYRRRDDHCPS
ncbi:IS701 family transposase [Glycomyces sp. L485]|uniref:IS701 family transposase n=1 Tax=Glycomyces sp. L485 TaxID=2909235 RepID=UPI001F4A5A63|nr:IS701 family transposase [Glycomyces sp. L485]